MKKYGQVQSSNCYGAIGEPWGFSATGRRDNVRSTEADPEGNIPTRFRVRLATSVCVVFLALMLIFLTLSFESERRRHLGQTFEHLEETLGVLVIAVGTRGEVPVQAVRRIEASLRERTGVEHRLIVTETDGNVRSASAAKSVGYNIESVVRLKPRNVSSGYRALGFYDERNWLVAAIPRSNLFSGDKLFLLRDRSDSAAFIRRFGTIHGLHLIVTLLALGGLVQFIGRRYVTAPILQLATSIRRIEAGDLTAEAVLKTNDEFGWLAHRFAEMGLRLKQAIRQMVRSEKYASVAVVTYRVARKLHDPLRAIERHITYIDGLSADCKDLERISGALRQDRAEIMKVIRQLEEIQPPEDR